MKQSNYPFHLSSAGVNPDITQGYDAFLKAPTLCSPKVTHWQQPAITQAVRVAERKADLAAANRVTGKAGRFLKSAAMRALNNLKKIGE